MEEFVLISYSRDELKDIFQECLKEEIGKIELIMPEPKKTNPELLSVKDLTKMFGVSKVTIFKWRKDGKLKSYKQGKKVYFKREEVMQAFEEKEGDRFGVMSSKMRYKDRALSKNWIAMKEHERQEGIPIQVSQDFRADHLKDEREFLKRGH